MDYKCELKNATHEGHEEKLIDEEMYSYHAAEVNITFNLRFILVYFVFLFKTLSLMFTLNYELELFSLFQDNSGNIVSVLFTKISSKTKHFKVIGEIQKQKDNYDDKDNDGDIDYISGAVEYWMLKMMIMTMTAGCFFSVSAIVFKILVRTMLLVKADLLRKVMGVFVPLDLRV